MSTLKISKHSDVPTALDLVKEEVDKESRRIFSAGGDALKAGNIKPAKEAIAYAERLADFVKKIQRLGDEWKRLEARIDAAAPEVQDIVRPAKARNVKAGFTRKVTHVSPKTNFTVRFPDGKVIADAKAFRVLARTIEALGPDRVAALGMMCGGEPLVTKNRAELRKHPTAIAAIAGGWFVKTHSGTAAKMGYVKRIAKALKVKLLLAKI